MELTQVKALIRNTIADLDKLPAIDADYSRGCKDAYKAALEILERVESIGIEEQSIILKG